MASGSDEERRDDRLMLGLTFGLIVGVAVVGVGFATAPAGAGVWYGYGVVIGALVVGTAVAMLVGYGVGGER